MPVPPLSRRPRWFSAAALAAAPPVVKLGALVAGVAVIGGGVQLGAMLLGLDFWVLGAQGSGLLIVAALSLLLALIGLEGRPMADYGLVADAAWRRRAGRGLLLGAGFYLGYLAIAWVGGVLSLRTEYLSPERMAKGVLAALSAAPLAATQQIIFAGYLVSMVRQRHSRLAAVVLPAGLFAVVAVAGRDSLYGSRLFVGLLLLATLLNLWRLRTGTIAFSAGVLAGAIAVRKLLSKTLVLQFNLEAPLADWLAPFGDPRCAPLMAGLLLGGIAWSWLRLNRDGEAHPEVDEEANATFMRVLPFSNLMAFAPAERWVALLWQAGFRIGPAYLPRLAVTLLASFANTLLALPERLIAPWVLRRTPPDPVFIVGMPRSGTTHLHYLLSLDPRFRSPRNYEAFNPHGFLTGWLTTAVLTPVLSWRRPMDSVQMSVMSSQEEEFALAALGCPSPYWSFAFPRQISRHDAYWRPEGFSAGEERRWAHRYKLFLRKLTCVRRRTPLLKNPANTGRVKLLRRHFPGGKFIHIVRRPHDVYRSNKRLASHGLAVFQLQDPDPADNYSTRCLANYRSLMDAYYADTADLPADAVAEVSYEDLVSDPLQSIQAIYQQLGLPLTQAYQRRLENYLKSVEGYRRNRFATLSADEQAQVDSVMAPYLAQWGYDAPQCQAA